MNEAAFNKATTFFQFASAHFALISALLIALGMMSATVFISGYLSVFDWRLIWFIEYSDLLKFGLIAVSFFVGIIYLVQGPVGLFFQAIDSEGKPRKVALGFLLLSLVLMFGPRFYMDYVGPESRWFKHVVQLIAAMLFGMLLLSARHWAKGNFTFKRLGEDAMMFVAFLALLGSVFGHHVKDRKGFDNSVILEDRRIDNVSIVMFTYHHAVLIGEDETVVVIPSNLVREVRSKD